MRSKIQDSGFKFLLNTEKFNDNVNDNPNLNLETWNMKRAFGAKRDKDTMGVFTESGRDGKIWGKGKFCGWKFVMRNICDNFAWKK